VEFFAFFEPRHNTLLRPGSLTSIPSAGKLTVWVCIKSPSEKSSAPGAGFTHTENNSGSGLDHRDEINFGR
jgi:hypothetical protein